MAKFAASPRKRLDSLDTRFAELESDYRSLRAALIVMGVLPEPAGTQHPELAPHLELVKSS